MTTKRFDRIADIAGAEDWDHAPLETSLGLFFDIASVLDMSDIEGDVTPEPFARWQYRRTPFTVPSIETVADRYISEFSEGEWSDDYTYGQIELAYALHNEQITQADLIYAGDVLNRYLELLKLADRDY